MPTKRLLAVRRCNKYTHIIYIEREKEREREKISKKKGKRTHTNIKKSKNLKTEQKL